VAAEKQKGLAWRLIPKVLLFVWQINNIFQIVWRLEIFLNRVEPLIELLLREVMSENVHVFASGIFKPFIQRFSEFVFNVLGGGLVGFNGE
jgi:hypothetical protein